jgi:hypothetical protein
MIFITSYPAFPHAHHWVFNPLLFSPGRSIGLGTGYYRCSAVDTGSFQFQGSIKNIWTFSRHQQVQE